MRCTPLFIAIGLTLVAGGCSSDDDHSARPTTTVRAEAGLDEARLDALVERFVHAADVPGAVMAVRRGDDRWVGAAGLADPEAGQALRTDAIIPIASITKTFVAALVLQEVEAGNLSLDDTLATWMPEWPRATEIKVRNLLQHTSGIGDYMQNEQLRSRLLDDLERAWTPAETVGLARDMPPLFDVGASWSYSNTNYLLLGMILEQVTTTSLHDLIDERLTRPLGLDDTQLFDGASPLDARVPHLLYDLNGDGKYVDVRDFPTRAAFTTKWAEGGMLSTAGDLVDWATALWGGDDVIADGDLRSQMVDTTEWGYGFGTAGSCPCLGAPRDHLRFTGNGHQGDFYGSRAIVTYWPSSDVAVAILTNQSPVGGLLLDRAAIEARSIVAGDDDTAI